VEKVARRAGRAAPAVAVIGALAAIPQVRDLVAGSHPDTAHTAARLVGPDQIGAAAAARSQEAQAGQHLKVAALAAGHAVARHRAAAAPADASHPLTGATPSPPASPTASAPSSGSGSGGGTCSASASGLLPDNYAAIVTFLTSNGYTGIAASGIAGNMYQESKGDPESQGDGGGGLIGWTPLPAGLVTGNPSADLQAQLEAVLAFNREWSPYIPALNSAGTPAAAADIYVTDFERAGVPAAGTREAAAEAVAAACGV
jgi:hypothetical protein